ncbi:hypothetical protein ABBQ38_003565 [Trebouxia sp. C0009 RCD-2024]
MWRRCAELGIRDPALQCKLFDTLAPAILSYAVEASRQPDHDQKVQPRLKRRQTIKAAGKAQGQQTLQFKQA